MLVAVVLIFLVFVAILHLLACAVQNGKSATKNRYHQTNSLNFSSTDTANCSSPSTGPLIQFDVFVSYSKRDEETVVQQFCRPLESQDFTYSVSDELILQLKASQTLLIYITRNFLENEWASLSIKTSHQLFAKAKNKKLIAIMGDDVSQNELESELGQILRKNTLIPRSHHLFWNLLMSAIPRRGSPNGSETSQLYSEPHYGSVHSQVPSQFV
uniref:TIR domain-containing protein n=1 Tax=Ditylenchus dipsaci TaxID=166011 RepID=A0A915EA09_9BILA